LGDIGTDIEHYRLSLHDVSPMIKLRGAGVEHTGVSLRSNRRSWPLDSSSTLGGVGGGILCVSVSRGRADADGGPSTPASSTVSEERRKHHTSGRSSLKFVARTERVRTGHYNCLLGRR